MNRSRNRIGIIEVGSKSVRLLVADVSVGYIKPQMYKSEFMPVRAVKELNDTEFLNHNLRIDAAVKKFKEIARLEGAEKIISFGTAIAREIGIRLGVKDEIGREGVKILSKKDEALYSLYAAYFGCKDQLDRSKSILVVDQGGGSLEMAWGAPSPLGIELLDTKSYKLGTSELLKIYESKKNNISQYDHEIIKRVQSYSMIDRSLSDVVVLGSTATTCAWLKFRPENAERFDPRLVHSKRLDVEELMEWRLQLSALIESRSPLLRDLFSFQSSDSDAPTKLLISILPMLQFFSIHSVKTFVVCADTTRQGIAHAIAHGSDPWS